MAITQQPTDGKASSSAGATAVSYSSEAVDASVLTTCSKVNVFLSVVRGRCTTMLRPEAASSLVGGPRIAIAAIFRLIFEKDTDRRGRGGCGNQAAKPSQTSTSLAPPFASRPRSGARARARSLSLGSLTMLRTSILLCTASAAALSLVESPSVNDYELVATGKDCPQDGRINLPCGNCGPNVSVALTRTIFCTLLRTAHAL